MKKTAIVSCYFQPNYGSALQAYATQMALDKLNYKNETIDISGFRREIKRAKIKYFVKASLTSGILVTKLGMAKTILIRKFSRNEYTSLIKIRQQKFDEFNKKYFRLSPCYGSKAELSEKCIENYSAVVVGSDQLWLPGNIAADYYTLNFVPAEINTIAYATSFGQSSLPKGIEKKAQIFLNKIRHLSIREKSGQELIKRLSERDVPIVCDPTLLFTGEEWMSIQSEEAIIKKPYIFCYFLGNNSQHRKFAVKLKNATGYHIVALNHIDEFIKSDDEYADVSPTNIGPSEFLNLIRNANIVCTDSFHCSVFSILYEKKFFSFRRFKKNTKHSTNSRLDTLFRMVGIDGRIMKGNEVISDCIDVEIDYKKVNQLLESVRKLSYDYLLSALQDKRGINI